MSEEGWTERESAAARRFGEHIVKSGEPFSSRTLETIRTLVSETEDPGDDLVGGGGAAVRAISNFTDAAPDQVAKNAIELQGLVNDVGPDTYQERSGRRKLTLVEKMPGRVVRKLLTTPRGLSLLIFGSVSVWRPLFVPILALIILFAVLLVGVFVGQDRMARLLLHFLKRYVWADTARAESLQRVLPSRWHSFLYKPVSEDDPWEGLIDPGFEARLARLRG
ncbi:hypothetical protein [Shimia abyssi]|uniref:Uncharacterized protein n=1 Tax=Shimia abyssi TaxID=1662395 RepID=A0A2P8EXT8_9RHOB|nr:hypothetical protein [Shimia abyssi]PSL14277.1 hypothetical protein CLV88_12916 [Shimia abyssi]